ncbi:MAG: hypothetical protein HY808_10060 [Nitrospirae bacterium]|nr:hypothetical protein [Nitrospirota bacterium]
MKLIDIHTHGIGGFDTRTASEDDILQIAKIHGSHGVSEIIPTVYPSTIEAMRENMLAIKKAMEKQTEDRRQRTEVRSQKSVDSVDSRQETEDEENKLQAQIIGIHLEGPFLNPVKCGALDVQSFLKPDEYNLRKLLDGFEDVVKIITVAPEIDGASGIIKMITGMGIIVSMGHSDATYSEAEAGFNAGAKGITHLFNAMRGIHHREPGIAGFGLMNKEIYIEVIADPFHLDQKMIELIFLVKKPDRIIIVSDTIKGAELKFRSQGIRDCENKLLGGCMTIQESSERLIRIGLDREIVMKAVSENPIRYLQVK